MPKSLRFALPLLVMVTLVVVALPSSASNTESVLRQETMTATMEETPVGTETATTEPIATSTETPTTQPTSTTAAPIELLENGSFEGEDGKGDLAPWVHTGNRGEKVKCNKNNKVFAHDGNCAFRFKGNPLKSGKVTQTVDLTGLSVGLGDTLTFSMWINGKTTARGNGKAKVEYANGEKNKAKVKFNPSQNYVEVIDTLDVEADITEITVILKHSGRAGRFLVDDVSLLLEQGDAPVGTATATAEMTSTPEATGTSASLLPLP